MVVLLTTGGTLDTTRDTVPQQLHRIADQIENRFTYVLHLERENRIMRELLMDVWKDRSVVGKLVWQVKLHDELAGPEQWGTE